MEKNREQQLREELNEIEKEKRKQDLEKRSSDIINWVGKLPTPIAKARIFGEKSGLIPNEFSDKDKRDIIQGYTELEMYSRAAGLSERWFQDYEKAVELHLIDAKKELNKQDSLNPQSVSMHNAALIVKEKLHDTKRALDIFLNFNNPYGACIQAREWGEFSKGLEIAEKYGFFKHAVDFAYKLGNEKKMEFYQEASRIEYLINSK